MKQEVGSIGWIDLTVSDAPAVRDFYQAVVGWVTSEVDMGDYHDFCMNDPENGVTYAGICHARGGNSGIPAQWIMYVTVADLDASMQACTSGGGEVLGDPRQMGNQGRYCFIRDPAGAVCALYQSLD